MKNNFILALIIFFFIHEAQSQIYSQKIVYTFNYSIHKNGNVKKGQIYLGCLNKIFPYDSKQSSIIWTESKEWLEKEILTTGVIENKERIWIHPPRNDAFSILEYSPFPQIHFPIFVNSVSKKTSNNLINSYLS